MTKAQTPTSAAPPPPEASKADQMRSLIEELRAACKAAAGGVDRRVQVVLEKMERLMKPAE